MNTSDVTGGDHFAQRSLSARKTYDKLLTALRKIGPVREDPKKTSIYLVRTSAVVGFAVRKDYLVISG